MASHPTFTVISLARDMQSSVMALITRQGTFHRVRDCAILADPMRAVQRLRVPRMPQRPDALSSARRGQRKQPSRVTTESSQPPTHLHHARALHTYSRP